MFKNHKEQLEAYHEIAKLSLKERNAISYFFSYIRSEMQSGNLNEIRLKYFGTFKVEDLSVLKYQKRINDNVSNKEIREEINYKINSYLSNGKT